MQFQYAQFNPEFAPLEILLKQAEDLETLTGNDRTFANQRLQELYVILLRNLVNDQLAYLKIARHWFTAKDFRMILERRIGTGKIGGKSAGMLLAYKILQNTAPEISENIVLPRSYYIGSDLFNGILAFNNLDFGDQKYKTIEEIRTEYPTIREQLSAAYFPDEIMHQLDKVVHEMGNTPLIVRSSSLLEDSFGASFAGKYDSLFLPNQGTVRENLQALVQAIRMVYASALNPNALIYRRRVGLQDYVERMALLLQEVQGEQHGKYFFPSMAGVAYSYSPVVWNTRQRREEGFVRLVMGLGTRAVDRIAGDYPRMINLSHPLLRPELTPQAIRHYSQHFIDTLDLEQNIKNTIPIELVLGPGQYAVRMMVSVDDGETVRPPLSIRKGFPPEQMILTFDGLLRSGNFVPLIKASLKRLAQEYGQSIDLEFAASFTPGSDGKKVSLHLLQCRPQNQQGIDGLSIPPIPENLAEDDKILACRRMVPQGYVDRIEYIVYVDIDDYYQLETQKEHFEITRLIGILNDGLDGSFILMGPGRWGSSDHTQGVPVNYSDIFKSRALVEVSGGQKGFNPEPSYGTHFYQELLESRIYPLAVLPEESGNYLNWKFIRNSENQIGKFIPDSVKPTRCIKVIHIPSERPGFHMEIVMDGEQGVGYLTSTRST